MIRLGQSHTIKNPDTTDTPKNVIMTQEDPRPPTKCVAALCGGPPLEAAVAVTAPIVEGGEGVAEYTDEASGGAVPENS